MPTIEKAARKLNIATRPEVTEELFNVPSLGHAKFRLGQRVDLRERFIAITSLQFSLNGPFHNGVQQMPSKPQQVPCILERTTCEDHVDGKGLKQRCEARVRSCPTKRHGFNSMRLAFYSRWLAMQEGFELHGIEMPPYTVWGLVIHATNRSAFWACARGRVCFTKISSRNFFHVQLDSIYHRNLRRTTGSLTAVL